MLMQLIMQMMHDGSVRDIYLPTHPPTYLLQPTYLPTYSNILIYLPTHWPTYYNQPTYLSTHPFICLLQSYLPVHPPSYYNLPTYPPIHPSIYLLQPTYHSSTYLLIDPPTHLLITYYNLPIHPPTYVPHSLVVMCQNKYVKFVLTKVEHLWWCGPLVKDLVYHWGGQGFNFW
jgi:hypothetical protein